MKKSKKEISRVEILTHRVVKITKGRSMNLSWHRLFLSLTNRIESSRRLFTPEVEKKSDFRLFRGRNRDQKASFVIDSRSNDACWRRCLSLSLSLSFHATQKRIYFIFFFLFGMSNGEVSRKKTRKLFVSPQQSDRKDLLEKKNQSHAQKNRKCDWISSCYVTCVLYSLVRLIIRSVLFPTYQIQPIRVAESEIQRFLLLQVKKYESIFATKKKKTKTALFEVEFRARKTHAWKIGRWNLHQRKVLKSDFHLSLSL